MAALNDEESEDPFDWSIDQVVNQFCNNSRPVWSPNKPPQHMPDPVFLEKALRDNDVDGENLLALDHVALKDDIGILSFGQRRSILKAIDTLRSQSRKFQQPTFHADAIARLNSSAFATPQVAASHISAYAQSPGVGGYGFRSSAELRQPYDSPGFSTYHELPPRATPIGPPRPFQLQNPVTPHMGTSFHSPGLDLVGTASSTIGTEVQPRGTEARQQNVANLTEDAALLSNVSCTTANTSIHNRLGPPESDPDARTPHLDALGAEIDQSLQEGNANHDSIVHQASPPHHPRSTSKFTVVNGRKKLAPTFVSHISQERTNAHISAMPVKPLHDGNLQNSYLEDSAHSIKDVFYPTPTDEDREFLLVPSDKPFGQRQQVGRLIKHALRQSVKILPGSSVKYRILYNNCSSLSHNDPQYFTIFAPGLDPAVRKVEDYPTVKASQLMSRKRSRRKIGFFKPYPETPPLVDPFLDSEPTEPDNSHLDYLLEKYPSKADDEDLLPDYGDSGDEGDYDSETWNEIQDEINERNQGKDTDIMTRAQVEMAINEAVDEFKATWREEKLPKVQMKAYRLWNKAARENQRQMEINNALFWVEHFDTAIKKFQDAILEDIWHKPAEVKHQCQSFEESVLQREEKLYIIEVLSETRPPVRPDFATVLKAKAKVRPEMPDGEELLESESDIPLDEFMDDEETSDDGSIPHDAPDPEVDASLALLPVREAGARLESLRSQQELSASDESPELTDGNLGGLPSPAEEPAIDSGSSEDMIVSPAGRKRIKRAANIGTTVGRRKHGTGFHVPQDPEDDILHLGNHGEDDTDQDSDPDLFRLPRARYHDHGRTEHQAIDLTLSSSPSRAEHADHESVRTPELNPQDEELSPIRKLELGASRARSTTSESGESSLQPVLTQPSDDSGLPRLEDVLEIQQLDWDIVFQEEDGHRALAKAVYELELDVAEKLRTYITSIEDSESRRKILLEGLIALHQGGERMDRKARHIKSVSLLFVTFVCLANMMNMLQDPEEISESDIQKSYDCINSASQQFFNCLHRTLNAYISHLHGTMRRLRKRKVDTRDELEDHSEISQPATDSDGSIQDVDEPSTHRKRKREVMESQEAKHQQINDQLRVKEEERRKAILTGKLLAMDITGNDPSAHVVNTIEPYITLDPHIGQRVKPHQVDGISFMWREIIADPKKQGCLLAHTMGLGKTMQVISLLYTVAQSGASPDPAIRRQVPKQLQHIRALILCPPSLIDNWYDELLMWVPDQKVLGRIFKFSKSSRRQRLLIVRTWAAVGGILLISYDMFRAMILNKAKLYDDDDHRELEDNLLNGPNIIVADEAHKMKNAASKITMVAKRFRSLSRIALTGSPLNNHLEEYYTMVDWIAPGYLGNIVQFRAKYSEPINAGLHSDSSAKERRVSLKKLHVLKRDLDPKINRADISAIEKDMPSKTEFFITIPLTETQAEAYNIFIDFILEGGSKTSNARLWSWLAILVLLCAHPSCFVHKFELEIADTDEDAITKSKPKPKSKSKTTTDDDVSSAAPDDVASTDLDFSVEFRERVVGVFRNHDLGDFLGTVKLSYRSLIVQQIIYEARRIGDKTLVFSHSIPTLNYLEALLKEMGCSYARIDGVTKMSKRQDATKSFNSEYSDQHVFLISMRAGGLGLNIQGANRIIIYDFSWNPTWEEQAIGRAYRLGQKKPVFVYRFRAGGTFEDILYNKAVFKTQLFQRVVDKKNYLSRASKSARDYLFRTKDVPLQDFTESIGKDPEVLDLIIDRTDCIRNIELTETFQREEDEDLTPEERKAADEEYQDQVLERNDPEAFAAKKQQQQMEALARQTFPNQPAIPRSKPQWGMQVPMPALRAYAFVPSIYNAGVVPHPDVNMLGHNQRHDYMRPVVDEAVDDELMPDVPQSKILQMDGTNDHPDEIRQQVSARDKDDCKTQ
jgi:SNF2 family DNA or RNA helicase